MGKTKKSNMKTEKNVPLDRQILESKVVKSKNRNKIKLRSEETSVSILDFILLLLQIVTRRILSSSTR